ncbi:MAG: IS21 family transposase [Actinomycetota bacterium]|jgi:transposase|nr:IS21 family transposase [Actinomycetota bacterium]
MNKVREIIRLHESAGLSIRQISKALSVSRPVVDQYLRLARSADLKWAEIEPMDDEQLLERLEALTARPEAPRCIELQKRLPRIVMELGRPHVTRQLLWEEYRSECRDGYGHTQFCHHLQMYIGGSELSMHIEHEPGRKVFVDFAGDRPVLTDSKTGSERAVELFVAVYPASGLIYAEATENQRIASLVSATVHTFEYAGGAPAIVVPDNLKAGVTKANRYEPHINPTYEDFARYYGCAVVPARPRKPRDKALVEAAVNLVYTRVLARLRDRRFATLEEFNAAIGELIDELNDRPMQKIGVSRRARFDELEAEQLCELPERPYVLRHFLDDVKIAFNYHLYFPVDKHYYSVPYEYRTKRVRVAWTETEVEIIWNNRRIACHPRERVAHRYTSKADHMPSTHRFVAEWSPERFESRAAKVGPATQTLIHAVLSARKVPEQAFRSCMGLLELARSVGNHRMEAAALRANRFGICSYTAVKRILDKGLEAQPLDAPPPVSVSEHLNLRGPEYYSSEPARSAS